MKKGDWILIIIVIIIAVLWRIGSGWRSSGNGAAAVEIWQDGKLLSTVSLKTSEKRVIPVDTEWGHNQVIVENGGARMGEADCPDQVCVHTSPIQKPGETIVCLPNRLVVEITGIKEGAVDDVSH